MAVTTLLLAGCLLAAAATSAASSSELPPKRTCMGGYPVFDHVIILMMENTAYSTLPNLTYTSQFYSQYSGAANYYGYTHDSEPNYVALTSGTNMCAHSDADNIFNQESIFQQLSNRRKTWKCYSQSIPSDGFLGDIWPVDAKSGHGFSGLYKYKHNPCAVYTFTRQPKFASLNTNYERFLSDLNSGVDLPAYSFVVPDQCHDLHGTTGCENATLLMADSDKFVKDFMTNLTSSDVWKTQKVFLAVVWDENDYTTTDGCCASPMNPGNFSAGNNDAPVNNKDCAEGIWQNYGVTSETYGGGHTIGFYAYSQATGRCTVTAPHNHLTVLKTIEAAWGLPYLGYVGLNTVPLLPECIFA